MKRVLLLLLFVAAACGREQSVAEKSAAAYREAQEKGIAVGGGHDHGHATAPATATTAADHAAHATMDHAAHGTAAGATDHAAHGAAAMDHGAHAAGARMDHAAHGAMPGGEHAQHRAAGADHAQHRAATGAHAQHGAAPHAQHGAATDPHAAHRAPATTTDPHAGHGAGVAQASGLTLEGAGRPEAYTTPLRPDPFDAPAPSAVSEAEKARQGGGGHEGHQMRGITPGQDKENPPTPMPATRDRTTTNAPPAGHSQHGAVTYTCPMHPEVTSDKPGTCPKCGMALVEKK